MEATMRPMDAATERFIHGENLIHLRKRLTETTDAAQRQQILALLSEEEAKNRQPPLEK